MNVDPKVCHHQLSRPPDLVTDVEGISYLLFECLLCGREIGLRLNAEGQVDGEFIITSTAGLRLPMATFGHLSRSWCPVPVINEKGRNHGILLGTKGWAPR